MQNSLGLVIKVMGRIVNFMQLRGKDITHRHVQGLIHHFHCCERMSQ
jgi:hypothetical protein